MNLREFTNDDIDLMKKWLKQDFIIKWYEDAEDWLYEINNRHTKFSFIKHLIVEHEEKPIGFCQYYTCVDAGEDWYGDILLNGAYSIDYLIGEKSLLGKGLGKKIIELLTQRIWAIPNAEKIIVKPETDNLPSCKSLISNNFKYDKKNELYIKHR